MAGCQTRLHADSQPDRSVPEPSPWALSRGEWLPSVVDSIKFDVPVDAAAAAAARRQVLQALGGLLGETERSNLELMVSELVTNSVRHAGMNAQTDRITVHAAVAPERLRIEVCDTGRGFDPGRPKLRSFEARGSAFKGEGGLGLVLLDRLAAAWGVAAEHEVCVWAEFDRDVEEVVT